MNFLAAGQLSAWFPPEASEHAAGVDGAFFGLYVAAAFAVILVFGLAATFVMTFRRKNEDDRGRVTRPNIVFQALWVLGALGLAVFAFTSGFDGFLDQSVAPYRAYSVDVTARQWDFDFTYPNGFQADTLHVATGIPVQLNLQSEDVAHSLTIPALRLNQGILPDRTTTAWFTADKADTFTLRSNTYSGEGFADMQTVMISHTPADFETWLATVSDIFSGRTYVEVGELLYNRQGCKACHTLDGSKLVGPSFKDMYGNTFPTRAGVDVVVDAAYVKESILYPNVSVIAGYEPVMTPYEGKLNDREIEAITAWLRTLSQYTPAEELEATENAEGQAAPAEEGN
jgi:cytochrome c oxidase subunit 2